MKLNPEIYEDQLIVRLQQAAKEIDDLVTVAEAEVAEGEDVHPVVIANQKAAVRKINAAINFLYADHALYGSASTKKIIEEQKRMTPV